MKGSTLQVLKYYLYFFKGLLTYEATQSVLHKFELDYFVVNTLRGSEDIMSGKQIEKSMNFIPYKFTFKTKALCIKAMFKLSEIENSYSVLM
jgi:hypothetical protein